jgi:hypothetical protein
VQECDTILHSRSWDAASPAPSPTSPAPSTSLGSWSGVKVPVLAPTTFVEHAIVASEWTRVQPRRRRSSAPLSSPTTTSRGKLFKSDASLMWIKKHSARPRPGPPGSGQPSAPGFSTAPSRRSGLYRILGFHWRSQRGVAPVYHGDRPNAMAGRPDPAGKGAGSSGLFGAPRQGGGGNFSTGPSFGGGGNGAAFPQRGG